MWCTSARCRRSKRRPEHGTRVAHRVGRAFVAGDARPPPWTTLHRSEPNRSRSTYLTPGSCSRQRGHLCPTSCECGEIAAAATGRCRSLSPAAPSKAPSSLRCIPKLIRRLTAIPGSFAHADSDVGLPVATGLRTAESDGEHKSTAVRPAACALVVESCRDHDVTLNPERDSVLTERQRSKEYSDASLARAGRLLPWASDEALLDAFLDHPPPGTRPPRHCERKTASASFGCRMSPIRRWNSTRPRARSSSTRRTRHAWIWSALPEWQAPRRSPADARYPAHADPGAHARAPSRLLQQWPRVADARPPRS